MFVSENLFLFFGFAFLVNTSAIAANPPAQWPQFPAIRPPFTQEIPTSFKKHGHLRQDPYFWLGDREDPKVLAHLQKEQAYGDRILQPIRSQIQAIESELRVHTGEERGSEDSVFDSNAFQYFSLLPEGKVHRTYFRRPKKGGPEIKLFDLNAIYSSTNQLDCQAFEPSPDETRLAILCDPKGDGRFELLLWDVENKKRFPIFLQGLAPQLAWSNDSESLFLLVMDPITFRRQKLVRLPVSGGETLLIWEERDSEFELDMAVQAPRRFLVLESNKASSTEVRLVSLSRRAPPLLIEPRRNDHRYHVVDSGDQLILRSTKSGEYSLWQTNPKRLGEANWSPLFRNGSELRPVMQVVANRQFIAARWRKRGSNAVALLDRRSGIWMDVPFGEEALSMDLKPTTALDSREVRISYQSFVRPEEELVFQLDTKKAQVSPQKLMASQANSKGFLTTKVWFRASDEVEVPISLVRPSGPLRPGPLYVSGYGAYLTENDPLYEEWVPFLVERGFTVAIIHVRGGAELGHRWYEAGRALNKKRTFLDFVEGAEALVQLGYADPKRMYGQGGSAGGTLMGAVAIMRPDLFRLLFVDVPFLDVVGTMSNPEIPYTSTEYEEWGNPARRVDYFYQLAYSPYDNLLPRRYPFIWATTGWHDALVGYWEPAKWIARLRKNQRDPSRFALLRIDFTSGHGGSSSSEQSLRETAERMAFLLWVDSKGTR